MSVTFEDFNLQHDLLDGIRSMGYKQATPIQAQAIPHILEAKDLIACAQTGTGKTAAFLVPTLSKIAEAKFDFTSTLILVPTRELAKQIDDQVEGLSYFTGATSIAIYGGNNAQNWDQQKKALTSGADIIVATPGRLIAHMQMGYVRLDQVKYLILDEADKMLDMGFMDDLMKIISQLPKERQTLMFSATMPPKIRTFAKQILHDPEEISLSISKPAANIDQQIYLVYDNQKLRVLQHILKDAQIQTMILFTSRKNAVNDIVRSLQKMGFEAEGISSDKTQDEREATLQKFRNKQLQVLVATDVMSRGIDVDNISHVVNFDVPQDAEDYVHRIGRTARAGTKGMAITFVNEQDQERLVKIEKLIERELPKLPLPEGVGEGPAFDPVGNSRRGGRGGKPGSSAGRGRPDGRRREGQSSGGERRSDRPRRDDRKPRGEKPADGTAPASAPRPPRTEGQPQAPRAEGEEVKRKKKRRKKPANRPQAEGGGQVPAANPTSAAE
ncbi:DEAD/DEAH box helicase [Rufibacter quisquiliarum]|uniref:Superfamily II DNA/RNA helicase n=1 Tax=Rufibacter quisquiliarum TaxID=1549639 RepID=A0A839GIV9_9BACT|nr:DEAD/DEAH box helicase [Rufibacter quisquiliarum]MBA9078560.1 superfamily II DNA/RNA helicase [Rufibacter quisquiliarum]